VACDKAKLEIGGNDCREPMSSQSEANTANTEADVGRGEINSSILPTTGDQSSSTGTMSQTIPFFFSASWNISATS
jgi:hypothetical protein